MDKTFSQCIAYSDVLKSEPAMCVTEKESMVNGRLVLTAKRLLFGTDMRTCPLYSIDLDTINSIARESYFTDHNILAVTFLQYETARFSVPDCDDWSKAIETQRMTPHI